MLGRPRECPGDKLGLSLGQTHFFSRDKPRFSPHFTQWKPSLSQGQTQFVPGTIPGTKRGRKSLCVKSLCAFFARYSVLGKMMFELNRYLFSNKGTHLGREFRPAVCGLIPDLGGTVNGGQNWVGICDTLMPLAMRQANTVSPMKCDNRFFVCFPCTTKQGKEDEGTLWEISRKWSYSPHYCPHSWNSLEILWRISKMIPSFFCTAFFPFFLFFSLSTRPLPRQFSFLWNSLFLGPQNYSIW